jgi:hypothetical protein
MGFDEISGKRIVVVKYPTTSPYYTVLIYQLNSQNVSVLYKTRFYRKQIRGIGINLYKHFILITCAPSRIVAKNLVKHTVFLFDFTKARFEGKVVIPKKDICCTLRYVIHLGWHGILLISCGQGATVYDSIESNLTGYLNLILRNGIIIPSNHPLSLHISKSGNVYFLGPVGAITVYRRENRYQPVKHMIRHIRSIQDRQVYCFKVDIWSATPNIMCLPGPDAIAFLNLCHPFDNIVKKRSSNNIILREVIPSFHPPSKDTDPDHFYFSMDGSLLHLIRSPKMVANVKEHLVSTDIYTRMTS